MNETKTVPQQLKALLEGYRFNPRSLSIYLGITEEKMEQFSSGDFACLPDNEEFRLRLFRKIMALYNSGASDKDAILTDFLRALVTYHQISTETLAIMAGVSEDDVSGLLSDPPQPVTDNAKGKIAVTAMALRFTLKDFEPTA